MLNLLAPVEVVDFPLAFLRFGDIPTVIADTAYSDGVAGQTKVLQELWNFWLSRLNLPDIAVPQQVFSVYLAASSGLVEPWSTVAHPGRK